MGWLKKYWLGVGLVMLSWQVNAVTPTFWRETGYLYQANQTPIRKVLEDFSNQFGVMLEMDDSIRGTVDGRIAANSAVEFLDRLALLRKLRWFVYANTLYVSPLHDYRVEKIALDGENAADLRQVLVGVGLFETRFGWAERQDAQTVIVTGPQAYVRLVKQILGKKEAPRSDSEIMIFRLRYANAEDREIQYRNRTITTPGVASILRKLLQEKKSFNRGLDVADAVKNPFSPDFSQTVGRVLNQQQNQNNGGNMNNRPPPNPFAFLGNSDGSGDNVLDQPSQQRNADLPSFQLASPPKKGELRAPIVESDARMNAIIIRDDPSKRAYYQSLIDQFDIQPKMVEIEALIIDVNRSKMRDIGIDWGVRSGSNQAGVSATGAASFGQALSTLAPGSSVLLKNLERFYVNIRALEQKGDAYILAKPSVLTMDNLGAVLDLSQTAYIKIQGERVADVLPVTAGTMLRVTPRVIYENRQNKIHLLVDIEDGTVQEKQGSATPSVQKSTISTQAIIDENQALIIGGYQAFNSNRYNQKVPVLGSIPILGRLFTTEQNTDSDKERLFVIVPRALARTYGPSNSMPQPQAISAPVMPISQNGAGRVFNPNPTFEGRPTRYIQTTQTQFKNVIQGTPSRVIQIKDKSNSVKINHTPPIQKVSIDEIEFKH